MRLGFLTELDVSLKDDDTIWVLDNPLVYRSAIIGLVEVPKGFQTDFASVPRIPVVYDFYGDRAHRESVIHDYLYCKDSIPVVTFDGANRVFLEAMEIRGKAWWIRRAMYAGVCIGGRPYYHKRCVMEGICESL